VAHQRQTIREAVKTALVDASTAAGSRVYESRVSAHRRLRLPAIAIYTMEEVCDDRKTAPRVLKRDLTLAIEGAVKLAADVDDAMDSLADEIEVAMHADPTFGGVMADSVLTSTAIDIAEEGDQPIGVIRLDYRVTYYTDAPDESDVVLDDLEGIDGTMDHEL